MNLRSPLGTLLPAATAALTLLLPAGPAAAAMPDAQSASDVPNTRFENRDQHPVAAPTALGPGDGDRCDERPGRRDHEPGRCEHEAERPAKKEKRSKKRKRSYFSDVSKGWFHIGGGGSAVGFRASGAHWSTVSSVAVGPRLTMGSGFYTWFFYGGGSVDLDINPYSGLQTTLSGMLGVALPIPVFHPMFGVRVGGGTMFTPEGIVPQGMLVGQMGFILRKFDRRKGVRVVVEIGGVTDARNAPDPMPYAGFTLSLVL